MPCINAMDKRGGCDSSAVLIKNGVECMTPHDPQSERVYGTDAAYPSLPANSGGGQNRQAICFQQNQRCEVRDLGGAAGALQSEPGMKQQNFLAIPVAMRGNRSASDRGKLPETDGGGAAYSLTSVEKDSMVAVGIREWRTTKGEDVMPTLTIDLARMVSNQQQNAGGYLCGPMP